MFEESPEEIVKIETERLGMRYSDLIPVAIKAIQEQQGMIDELEKRNKILLKMIESLED